MFMHFCACMHAYVSVCVSGVECVSSSSAKQGIIIISLDSGEQHVQNGAGKSEFFYVFLCVLNILNNSEFGLCVSIQKLYL